MAQGMFSWFTNEYLPVGFDLGTMDNLAAMFVFLGIGFVALSLIFVLMYRYAASLKAELLLNELECYQTQTFQIIWLGVAVIGGISIILAMTLPLERAPFSGFAYSLMMIWLPLIRRHRSKQWRLRKQS